ncbi:MAG: insulinase family protein [Muribaculaceae bacterium]|nr:insulinase family protein [Muribaculaceae bacterium]
MAIDRSTPPPVSDFRNIKLDIPDPVILSNGMKLWIVGNGEDEINKLSIYMTGGTFQEDLPMQATTCSMAVFNGNKNMNYAQIAEAIDYYGSWRSAQVYDNNTEFAISSLNENFRHTLPIFIDSLRFPVFPDNEFELNKRQLAVNIATAREKVKYIANKEMMRQYFGINHPLASDPTPDDINSLTQEQIKGFYSNYYKAQNCNLVIAGHITDKVIATIEDVISQWKFDGKPASSEEPKASPSSEKLKLVHKEGAVQAAIAMALKTVPRRHPDYLKIRILTTILGGYFGSRLMSNIREDKGYTYGIGSSLSGRSFDGHISISTECDTQYCWDVIKETKKEMQRLCTEPISDEELGMVKRHMLSDLVKTLDTPFNIAGYIGNTFLYGTYPTYFNEHIQAIINVSSKDILETAQRYLDTSLMHIVIVCDKNKLPQKDFS